MNPKSILLVSISALSYSVAITHPSQNVAVERIHRRQLGAVFGALGLGGNANSAAATAKGLKASEAVAKSITETGSLIADPLEGVKAGRKGTAALQRLTADDTARGNNDWMAQCGSGVAACMWTEGTANNPNTNVCDDAVTGPVHCHGTVIQDGQLEMAKLTMQYIQMGDHVSQRGYTGAIAGFNSCDCLENLPAVSRCDSSMMNANPTKLLANGLPDALAAGNFNNGAGNNLANTFKKFNAGKAVTGNLVGSCNSAAGQAALKEQQTKLQSGLIGAKSNAKAPVANASENSEAPVADASENSASPTSSTALVSTNDTSVEQTAATAGFLLIGAKSNAKAPVANASEI